MGCPIAETKEEGVRVEKNSHTETWDDRVVGEESRGREWEGELKERRVQGGMRGHMG